MTNPTQYALVPKVPTEEMVDAGWCADGEFDQRYAAAIAASPHAGEVSREQVKRSATLMSNLRLSGVGPEQIVERMYRALGLSVEGGN